MDCARSDAAVLARVAELAAEARWARLYRAHQQYVHPKNTEYTASNT